MLETGRVYVRNGIMVRTCSIGSHSSFYKAQPSVDVRKARDWVINQGRVQVINRVFLH